MSSSFSNYENIANNVSALARETSLLLEQSRVEKIIERIYVKDIQNYTQSDTFLLGEKLNQDYYYKSIPVLFLDGDISTMSKDNKVTLEYRYKDKKGTLQCKWQGDTSTRYPKKNFSLTKINPALDLGWGVHNKYVVKADWVDSSLSYNVCLAKLWGQVVRSRYSDNEITNKLKACPNGGAIDGFPIVLIINNTFHGLYNFNIPKDKWMMNMGEGEYEFILPCEHGGNPAGFKGTTTKDDLLNERTFSYEYITSDSLQDDCLNKLNTLITYCINNQNNSNFIDELNDLVDIDSVIDYYIFTVIIMNSDGYNKNYLLGSFDGQKMFFTAYDLDLSLRYNPTIDESFKSFADYHNLMNLFYKYKKNLLKERYYELRNTVFSKNNFLSIFQNYINSVPNDIREKEFETWPTRAKPNDTPLKPIEELYDRSCKKCDAEVESWNV